MEKMNKFRSFMLKMTWKWWFLEIFLLFLQN